SQEQIQSGQEQPDKMVDTDYRRWCEDLLPDYMVPSVFVVLESLPLTVNGKIDRRALQARFETEGALPKVRYVAPETREAVVLCQLVAELLGVERVGLEDHFFQLGGHSLIATRLIAKLQLELGRAISIRDVFEQPILGVLAETLRNASCSDTPLLTAGMRPDPLPASFAQARLWLVEQIDGPMCRYVIPLTLRLDGRLDNAALWAALDD